MPAFTVDRMIDMDKVADLVRQITEGPCYVEQTGGGCATIYAGTPMETEDGLRYRAVAGPGWFNGPGWSLARGDLNDFYLGADDDGASDPRAAWPQDADEAYIAHAIARFMAEGVL